MKRLLFALILMPQLTFSQYLDKSFVMEKTEGVESTLVEQIITQGTEITLNKRSPITGFSISGRAILENMDDSYVRVVLKDTHNYEYLVYENYPMLTDTEITDFENTAIESMLLDNIIPMNIKIELHNACLELKSFNYAITTSSENNSKRLATIQKSQSKYIVETLNTNLEKHNKLWRAGVTSMSIKSYEDKKAMFGGKFPELYGFEYYKGGVFVVPGSESKKLQMGNSVITNTTSGQFVSEWDWRNRHGKNWVTSVKDQQNCGACWAFSAVAVLEAYANLYYNRLLNFDLSEQELISCDNNNNGCSGGNAYQAFRYIKQNGIVDENCFRYASSEDDCDLCPDPEELVFLNNYDALADNLYAFHSLSNSEVESRIKRKLFISPISFGILPWNHIINLIGYKTILSGDTIYMGNISDSNNTIVIDNSYSYFIGKTAWLVKNSWGNTWGDNGFGYIVAEKYNLNLPHYIHGKINRLNYNDSNILCTDEDGDGYYFWGLGPKPSHCPSWVPDEPDGDDSDYDYGPIDEYGNLIDIHSLNSQSIVISGNTIYGSPRYNYSVTIVPANSTLTVTSELTLYDGVYIIVYNGGKLIVDGGIINNANIQLQVGSELELKNGGIINMHSETDFNAPEGVLVNIEEGMINH